MTQEQKVIKAKVGLLELAKQFGSVSQAWKPIEKGPPGSSGRPYQGESG